MKFKNFQWITVALCLVGVTALADDLRLGQPQNAGTGCPSGTTAAVLSPDQKSLSILFDSYVAQTNVSQGKAADRKNCTIGIPVHVPQGYSISLFQVDYRGYTLVPWGGSVRFSSEYFFAGSRGPRRVESFIGPVDDDFLFTNYVAAEALVWSPCGAETNLRINTSLVAQANRYGEDTLASLDSADITAGVIYHIQWRRCY